MPKITFNGLWPPLLVSWAVGLLSHIGWVVPAILVAVAASVWPVIGRRGVSLATLQATAWRWLSGVSVAVIINLTPGKLGIFAFNGHLTSGDAILIGYAMWLFYLERGKIGQVKAMAIAAFNQFSAVAAIFMAASFWRWQSFAVVTLVWLASFLVADQLLGEDDDRARRPLAFAWALVAAEVAWVFSTWLVNYLLIWFGEESFVLPQAAIVLVALGYCFGGIYTAHRVAKLNRTRLFEYLMIGLVLLITVIAGTEWNKII